MLEPNMCPQSAVPNLFEKSTQCDIYFAIAQDEWSTVEDSKIYFANGIPSNYWDEKKSGDTLHNRYVTRLDIGQCRNPSPMSKHIGVEQLKWFVPKEFEGTDPARKEWTVHTVRMKWLNLWRYWTDFYDMGLIRKIVVWSLICRHFMELSLSVTE